MIFLNTLLEDFDTFWLKGMSLTETGLGLVFYPVQNLIFLTSSESVVI